MLAERKAFNYPPYSRLSQIALKGTDMNAVDNAATILAHNLVQLLGQERILGPDAPPVSRVQYRYIRRILIKAGLELQPTQVRAIIKEAVARAASDNSLKGITVSFDSDPQ